MLLKQIARSTVSHRNPEKSIKCACPRMPRQRLTTAGEIAAKTKCITSTKVRRCRRRQIDDESANSLLSRNRSSRLNEVHIDFETRPKSNPPTFAKHSPRSKPDRLRGPVHANAPRCRELVFDNGNLSVPNCRAHEPGVDLGARNTQPPEVSDHESRSRRRPVQASKRNSRPCKIQIKRPRPRAGDRWRRSLNRCHHGTARQIGPKRP